MEAMEEDCLGDVQNYQLEENNKPVVVVVVDRLEQDMLVQLEVVNVAQVVVVEDADAEMVRGSLQVQFHWYFQYLDLELGLQ